MQGFKVALLVVIALLLLVTMVDRSREPKQMESWPNALIAPGSSSSACAVTKNAWQTIKNHSSKPWIASAFPSTHSAAALNKASSSAKAADRSHSKGHTQNQSEQTAADHPL